MPRSWVPARWPRCIVSVVLQHFRSATRTCTRNAKCSALNGVAIPCKTSCNVRGTNRAVIAERELNGERLVDAVDVAHAKLDQRRRVQVDDGKVGLAFRRNGANPIADIERFGSPARREPPCGRRSRHLEHEMAPRHVPLEKAERPAVADYLRAQAPISGGA